jgi:hypothetical protein
MERHDPECDWDNGGYPCLQFSTDGTTLGAEIAHSMGTTSEREILAMRGGNPGIDITYGEMTGMPEEQADWEEE